MADTRSTLRLLIEAPALVVLGCLCGCLVSPRAGYPWIESPDLALEAERLQVSIRGDIATVAAEMSFVARRDLSTIELAFPEDERDPPLERFAVSVDDHPEATRSPRGGSWQGMLPLRHVRRWHVFAVPAISRGASRVIVARYRQRLRGGCLRYLLRTGAYWHGPIADLVVEVDLSPAARVEQAHIDGHLPEVRKGEQGTTRLRWSLRAFEPRGDLRICLASDSVAM
jgi:hypothetical protein